MCNSRRFGLLIVLIGALSLDCAAQTARPFPSVPASLGGASPGAPTNANPADGATGIATTVVLSCSASGASTFEINFNSGGFTSLGSNCSSSRSSLSNNTAYTWQIRATNAYGSTTGAVWTFTTVQAAPATPNTPNPASTATGISTAPTLGFSSSGSTSYSILGPDTSNPPTTNHSLGGTPSYSASGLLNNTTYFWKATGTNGAGSTVGPVWSFTTVTAGGQHTPTASNFEFIGYFRQPSTVVDTDSAYGAMTGRVDSNGDVRIFAYGTPIGTAIANVEFGTSATVFGLGAPSTITSGTSSTFFNIAESDRFNLEPLSVTVRRAANGFAPESRTAQTFTVASGSSASVFTVEAGTTGLFANGTFILMYRAANSYLQEARTVASHSGTQITLTVPLGGTPAAGDVFTSTTAIKVSPALGGTPANGDSITPQGQGASFAAGQRITVKRAANGNNVPESTVIQSISGDQLTVSPALAAAPVTGDTVHLTGDLMYEFTAPCTGVTAVNACFKTDPTVAPRGTNGLKWGDIYFGRRAGWLANGTIQYPLGYQIPAGLYFNPSNNCLYWGYYDAYNSTLQPWANMGCTVLNLSNNTITEVRGPWKTVATDRDGSVWVGGAKAAYFWPAFNGQMATHGAYFVSHVGPWGPTKYTGANWPFSETSGAASSITLPTRELDYYYMGVDCSNCGNNYFNNDGSVHAGGVVRSFLRPASMNRPYFFETCQAGMVCYTEHGQSIGEALGLPCITANPSSNDGLNSWAWLDGLNGGIDISLTNLKFTMFSAGMVGSADTNPTHAAAAHTWYLNVGQAPVCQHGFGIPDVPNIAGPVTTAGFPAFIIFDPVRLASNGAGSTLDYTTTADTIIDLFTQYGLITAPNDALQARAVRLGFFDSRYNLLYVAIPVADTTTGGHQTLFGVFHIIDQ